MTLYTAISGTADTHALQAAFVLLADGSPAITQAMIVSKLGLDAEGEAQLDAMKAVYQSKNATGKARYLLTAQSAFMLAEKAWYTEAEFNTDLEI
jgi:hypothetical protein